MEKETNVIHIEMEQEYEQADKKGLGSIVAFRLSRVNRRAYLNGELKYSDSLDGAIYLAKKKSEEDPIIRLAAFLQGRDTMTEKQIMRLMRNHSANGGRSWERKAGSATSSSPLHLPEHVSHWPY